MPTLDCHGAPSSVVYLRVSCPAALGFEHRWRRGIVLVSSALLLLSPTRDVHAQSQYLGVVHGVVRDQAGGVLPGVAITATPVDSRPAVTTLTEASGFYALKDLIPGEYSIKAELAGFATLLHPQVIARTGRTLSLDLTMVLGSIDEAITVRRDSPLLETSSATVAVNVGGELQRALPLGARRDWADVLQLVPGTVGNQSQGLDFMHVHGANFGSQVIQLDGADVAAASQSSTLYMTLSNETLSDVQVKTAGVDASTPLGQGAVLNLATRSGTNTPHGTAVLSLQRRNWNSDNNPQGTVSGQSLTQPELTFGGPLVRDRSWLFGSYRYVSVTHGVSRSAAQLSALRSVLNDWNAPDGRIHNHQLFLKQTARAGQKHNISGFYQRGREVKVTPDATSERAFAEFALGGHSTAVNATSTWRSNFVTRIGISLNDHSSRGRLLREDAPARDVFTGTTLSGGRLVGTGLVARLDNNPWSQDLPTSKRVVTFDGTYSTDRKGSHEIQFGIYLNPHRARELVLGYPSSGFSLQEDVLIDPANPSRGSVPFHRRVYDSDRSLISRTSTRNYATYLQDTWRPLTRVTVTAGLRVDYIERGDDVSAVTVQRTAAIGPRLGVNVALTSDARNVLHATWGRVHDGVSEGTSTSAGSYLAGSRDEYDLNGDGVYDITFTTPPIDQRARNLLFDLHGFKQPHMDEWTAGYRRQLRGHIAIDAYVIRRHFNNRIARVEGNGIYDGQRFRGYRDESLNEVFQFTSNIWNRPVYKSASLQVARQGSLWQLVCSYSRQWRHLDGSWQPNDPASFIQPTAFSNDRGIGVQSEASTNSLSGLDQAIGGRAWRDHVLRAAVSATLWRGIDLSSSYSFQSGLWSGPVVTRISAADPQFGPTTLTLSNGRVVSNPLATTIRFAHPTRGEGQLRTRDLHLWSVRIGYRRSLGPGTATIAADLLNVPNEGTDQEFVIGANQTYSSLFGQTSARQAPRTALVYIRYAF